MKKRFVQNLMHLIRIVAPSKQEKPAADFIVKYCRALAFSRP